MSLFPLPMACSESSSTPRAILIAEEKFGSHLVVVGTGMCMGSPPGSICTGASHIASSALWSSTCKVDRIAVYLTGFCEDLLVLTDRKLVQCLAVRQSL